MTRFTFALILLLGLVGCASNGSKPMSSQTGAVTAEKSNGVNATSRTPTGNPYADTFVSRDRPTVALKPDPDGPKIYAGESKDDDYQRMLERGFDMIGYSSFDGIEVSPDALKEHAKNIKADAVLVYTERADPKQLTVNMQQIRDKIAAKKAAEGKPVDSDKAASQPAPEVKPQYTYFASYWVRLQPPMIGVHVTGPTKDADVKGLTIVAVVAGSPAFKAGLKADDILTQIGDVVLDKPEALTKSAHLYAGQTANVNYVRNGTPAKTTIMLNRP
ncbi:MAG: PDZ domain-containing protein [Methylophilaceae bacterium]|nr:PDZ domain-containing protein [Methyloradius sp.]